MMHDGQVISTDEGVVMPVRVPPPPQRLARRVCFDLLPEGDPSPREEDTDKNLETERNLQRHILVSRRDASP